MPSPAIDLGDLAQDPTLVEARNALVAALEEVQDRLTNGTQRSRLVDSAGAAITPENRLPVDLAADANLTINGDVNVSFESLISTVNFPTAPLAAGEEWEGSWENIRDYAAIVAVINTDVAGTAYAEFSEDPLEGPIRAITAAITPNIPTPFVFFPTGSYFRVRYVNGPAPQSVLRGEVRYTFNPPPVAQLPMGAQTTDLYLGGLIQSHLKGRHSSGAWLPLGTDGTGRLLTRDQTVGELLASLGKPEDAATLNTAIGRLKAIHAALQELDLSVDTLNLNTDTLEINTDEVEELLTGINTLLSGALTVAVNHAIDIISDPEREVGRVTVKNPVSTVSVDNAVDISDDETREIGRVTVKNQPPPTDVSALATEDTAAATRDRLPAALEAGRLAVSDAFTAVVFAPEQMADAPEVLEFVLDPMPELIWVRADMALTSDPMARVLLAPDTPAEGVGIPVESGVPQPLTVRAGTIRVWAPIGAAVNVWGYSY